MPSQVPLIKKLATYISRLPEKIFAPEELETKIYDFTLAVHSPLPLQINAQDYIDHFVFQNTLQRIVLKSGHSSIERLVKGQPSKYEIALSAKNNAYLSHATAAYLHNLVPSEPGKIYITAEQSPKPKTYSRLEQESIDYAFSQPQRKSGAEFTWDENKLLVLNSMYTGRLGVVTTKNYILTNLERTLLDMTVRPSYNGDALTILKAYQQALSKKLSVDTLINYLDAMEFIYPYHQSIGFYLEKVGYKGKKLEDLNNRPKTFKFYIDYEIKQPLFNEKWQVYYPKKMDNL